MDLYNAGPDSGSAISGIFIKNVLPNSPAGKTGQLKVNIQISSLFFNVLYLNKLKFNSFVKIHFALKHNVFFKLIIIKIH